MPPTEFFYRIAPFLFALVGILFGLSFFLANQIDSVDPNITRAVWAIVILVQALAGYVCGQMVQRLHRAANTDALTGLANRRFFYSCLKREFDRRQRRQVPLSLAIMDLDGFKAVNDTHGHLVGDQVLVTLAAILRKNTRKYDVVARWGGDEFAIIFRGATVEQAAKVVERIGYIVRETLYAYNCNISAGIVNAGYEQDVDRIFVMADTALYKAKERRQQAGGKK